MYYQAKTRYYIEKISESMTQNGYFLLLKGLLASVEMENVLTFLQNHVKTGQRFSPSLKKVFLPFDATPLEKLRVVFISSFPCSELGRSSGLAFGTLPSEHGIVPLNPLFQVYKKASSFENAQEDLGFLADQGVLLLNQTPTVSPTSNSIKQHIQAWEFFIPYFLDMLGVHRPEVPVILFGQKPSRLKDLIINNPVFVVETPDPEKIKLTFEECNKYLISSGKPAIVF